MNTYQLVYTPGAEQECGQIEPLLVGICAAGTITQAQRKLYRAHNVNPKQPKGYKVVYVPPARPTARPTAAPQGGTAPKGYSPQGVQP